METDELLIRREGHLAWITFNRPAARNAMTWAMYDRLEEVCAEIEADPEVAVVILRGAGGEAFVAGTDIGQFRDFREPADATDYEARIERIVGRLEALPRPTIALIEGACVGGGAALALACDFRFATPGLRLGVPIAKTLGNTLSVTNLARLVDLVGAARTKEMLMLARLLGAEEAKAAGAVTDVFPPERIEDEVRAVAERLAGLAPLTLRATKEGIRRVLQGRRPALEQGSDLVRECYMSEDFRSAVRAFTEKTPHEWRGR
ncbi:enoyl-CoA hydratase/isomerase family protein [Sediminicurvatus halobius]|uniref:Enoyl-CoA hydratase n=1 Tax=Sediminicurvatus halobius TaxID=2182432 RepID=A0A2U2N9J1_9GAMM|nr:enoyl-CoA hydratase/isomerase family protein [Spiribacter halobius]PWG65747.1 enoyl-CoA hydratase [Spiribacter halobius]UEX77783.1 enoyl-CoA hydratase/isomerase family protein [Spiribacter halobius]